MTRQQTSSEAAIQNTCNDLARLMGVNPAPRIILRDPQFFAFQESLEHKLGEYDPHEDVLFISANFSEPSRTEGGRTVHPISDLTRTSVVESLRVVLRHHLVHVRLIKDGESSDAALTHSPTFQAQAKTLNIGRTLGDYRQAEENSENWLILIASVIVIVLLGVLYAKEHGYFN